MNLRRWYLTAVGVIVLGWSTNVFGQAPEPPQPADASPAPVAEISDSPSSATPTISVPEAMKAASEALSKKQFDRARELYLTVYRADPTHRDAALQYADTYYAESRYEESLVEFTKVAESFPQFETVYHWRGDAYRNLKRFAEAESDYTRALDLSPKSSLFLIERANVRAAQGRHLDAILDASVALRLSKSDQQRAQILTARGSYSQQRGDTASSLADFIAAANLQPDNAANLNTAAWHLASSPYPQQRNASLALEWATRACALTKYENANYLDTLAAACAECGRFEQAVAVQQAALELVTDTNRPSFETRLELYRNNRTLSSSER